MNIGWLLTSGVLLSSQTAVPADNDSTVPQDSAESDFAEPRKTEDPGPETAWNEYDFKILTFKWGIFGIIDWGTAFETRTAARQFVVTDDIKVRDFRLTFSGKLSTERSITYTCGLMYDAPSNTWFPRETGIQVALPELWGNLFVGRQKEGFSLNKISVGYAVWMMERMPMTEATIPIMADGVKWLGVHPSNRANWNLGFFHNKLVKSPSTGWYDNALVARVSYLPIREDAKVGTLMHLGIGYHWGQFSDGQAQLQSRPESSTAPYFLDTGPFPAEGNHTAGLEAYLRTGSWLIGSEYVFDKLRAPESGDPLFHGGELFAGWVITGENRPYSDIGGKFGYIIPERSAFDDGPGAVEVLLHLSYSDFDSGPIQGGRFFRLTPHVNWYLDEMVRLEFNYGLGFLDRFGLTGTTHFLQARLQLSIQ